MKVVIVGDGAIGMMTARVVLKNDPNCEVTLVAPRQRIACASTAAAAMFNSFAEVEAGTLENPVENVKWRFNRVAAKLWRELIPEIEQESGRLITAGFGTFIINNSVSDVLEDENYRAILQALRLEDEPFEVVDPSTIPKYNPEPRARALRGLYVANEGWVNPIELLQSLDVILESNPRFTRVDAKCIALQEERGLIDSVLLDDGAMQSGDCYVLCPGAAFSQIIANSDLPIKFPKVYYGAGCTVSLKTGSDTVGNCIRTPNRGLACGVYCAPRSGSETALGASNFVTDQPIDRPQLGSVYSLCKSAMEQINRTYYRSELISVNFGWRPVSEDTVPLLGQTEIGNLLVATGTRRDGLHCSPLIGEIISRILLNKELPYDTTLFSPNRKPIRHLSRQEAVDRYVQHSMNANYQHDYQSAKNKMDHVLAEAYRLEAESIHDGVGAIDWGIPTELMGVKKHEISVKQ